MITVRFLYLTGVRRGLFRNARLSGTWNNWGDIPMREIAGEDGCPAFEVDVDFDDALAGQEIRWGVRLDGPSGVNQWGTVTEDPDLGVIRPQRHTILPAAGGQATAPYYLTLSRFLGAQKFYVDGEEHLRFAVWAPNAQKAEVVFGKKDYGYIADDGTGIDPGLPVILLHKDTASGVWSSDPLPDFQSYVGLPYMYRIRNAQGATRLRTDIHSRWQIGRGNIDPQYGPWDGHPGTLDGSVSCSVVTDQDVVRKEFEPATDPPVQVTDDEFWSSEFTSGKPVPSRLTELVIYELHIGSLGYVPPDGGNVPVAGNLQDAMDFIPHLVSLGVNAVELLPMSEFGGMLAWGYGNTHHFVIESSAGGRDKYKHFIRECHRNGIAVIQDVVYNHFDTSRQARAEELYDSDAPEEDIYFWYEGRSADYSSPTHGYLQNGSSGRTPRLWEENVRQMFTSSAAEFAEEFHIDGFRVDLLEAIHRDQRREGDGVEIGAAKIFGHKLLREWSRTLNLIRPAVMRIAEDHSGWPAVTESTDMAGMGFNATWFSDLYHNLIGDKSDQDKAKVLRRAGFGTEDPVPMGQLAGSLAKTGDARIVYHESHDEAGNSSGSMRTIRVAVNDAPLFGPTRDSAEARTRVTAGISILSAGTPMFFMGEEIGAQKDCKYNGIIESREDILGERLGQGAKLFRYYQDLILLRRSSRGVRSRNIDIIHASDDNRVIAFTRNEGTTHELVVASLNNRPFREGYTIHSTAERLLPGAWQEIFNSDSRFYGGSDVGNFGATLPSQDGRISMHLPANGLIVLRKI